ncbi:hypothetical protein G4G28_00985 [Massilia sp. Dwa41.01b]|uniref:hypothetical protein n=1 Tax=unclassified Massilia TaxID=2609279 RepID=UPI001600B654|nr:MULTISPECIES: hypothetical protein [unclassified Massilia]QNA87402.1 hypothetical protein G4G28_00985 [Massilia sp. Dwa41.01b]QNA98308.1 hypothetical protein G4G31_04745 [Massilia sp. Se16.2.3]
MMKLAAFLFAVASCCNAQAACSTAIPLQGAVNVKQCDPASGQCRRADEVLQEYMRAVPDDGPEVLSIASHSSPWHLYDQDYRILDIDEVAAMVSQQGSNFKRVDLVASWSDAAPAPGSRSLAQKLSAALGGKPVTGQDGFVWISQNGALRTTHQAFTARLSGPYWVGKNEDVMASLVAGWAIDLEARFKETRDAAGLLQVAAAKEIFMLCPESALESYEESAALNNPVAAYNAAIIRLERKQPGDVAAAMKLLKQAAAQGDKKAEKKLTSLASISGAN